MNNKQLKKELNNSLENIEIYKEMLVRISNDFEDVFDDNFNKMSSLIQVQNICIAALNEQSILSGQAKQISCFFSYIHNTLKNEALDSIDREVLKYKG